MKIKNNYKIWELIFYAVCFFSFGWFLSSHYDSGEVQKKQQVESKQVDCIDYAKEMSEKVGLSNVVAFFDRWQGTALNERDKFGIPASFKLAQAAMETGYGTSNGAVKHNAFFGIHAPSSVNKTWKGKVWLGDPDSSGNKRQLCKYDTAWDSWRHHSNFLATNPRYTKLFKCNEFKDKKERLECWCKNVDATGYCESSTYGASLKWIIKKYKWYKLDY